MISRVVQQNTGCSVKCEFQMNNIFFYINRSHVILSVWFRVNWSTLDRYNILDPYVYQILMLYLKLKFNSMSCCFLHLNLATLRLELLRQLHLPEAEEGQFLDKMSLANLSYFLPSKMFYPFHSFVLACFPPGARFFGRDDTWPVPVW